jgi:histone acetyltransferase (RNA polymerase elongator complex component)
MNDEVLAKSRRGHSSHDVERALFLLKQNGIETGVHLMAGLPGDNLNSFIKSVESIIDLRPDMLRIHPVLIFKDTALHALYLKGQYRPLDLENAVDWCRRAVLRCERAGIPVIRVGLHPTVKIENDLVAGPYHPAFRSLVEGKIFFDMASNLLSNVSNGIDEALFKISPYDGSAFRGLNNRNMKKLRQISDPVKILVQEDPKHLKGSLTLKAGTASYRIDRLSMSHG